MTIIDILLIILIIVVIILCGYIYISLKKLNKTLDSINSEINSLKEKVYPLLADFADISKRAN